MDFDLELERARSVHRSGGIAEAIPIYERILQTEPDHPEALSLLGIAKLQTGCAADALSLLERAAALAPDQAKIQNNLGIALLSVGRLAEAITRFRAAGELDPALADAPYNLGNAFRASNRLEDAKRAYREALRINPAHAAANNNLGSVLQALDDMAAAVEQYRTAARNAPQSPEFLSNLVAALEALNRTEEAEREARELLRTAPDFPIARLMQARLDRRGGRLEAARTLLEPAIASEPAPAELCPLLYEQARVLDELGEYQGAFAACTRAKEVRGHLPDAARWDLAEYPRHVARYHAWFTAERIASIPGSPGYDTASPVFLVGFPRSGTTLIEQMLATHPGVATTGERTPLDRLSLARRPEGGSGMDLPDRLAALTAEDLNGYRRQYFEIADDVIGAPLGNRTLIDKMPLNIVELGVANWLFPCCKVIVALRDPRDAVLSCYMQNFQMNRAMQQFSSLEGAARLYAGVMGLWRHYRNILTMPWLEYRYEDLVSSPQATVTELLEFIGEKWNNAVDRYAEQAAENRIRTPSYEAVTRPIHSRAVGRWRNYEADLRPILPILEPFVDAFGYEPS